MIEARHVVSCFLQHEGRIALLRRSARVGTYRGKWAGVSGYLEEGVSPRAQALTEIREETGLSEGDVALAMEGQVVEVADEALGKRWLVHPFRFIVACPDRIRTDWENTELRWIAPEEISSFDTVPRLAEVWNSVAPAGSPD